MAHGLNTNLVHGWRKQARDGAVAVPATCLVAAPAKPAAGMAHFMAVSLTPGLSAPMPAPADIQLELRRGATAVKITWPVAAAADCAAWMRELLR